VPLLVKSILYLTIGGYVPAVVLVVFGTLVWWGVSRGAKAESRSVRIWAIAILIWGIARVGLMVLFLLTSVSEAHVESQFTLWYVGLTAGYLILGVHLFRRTSRMSLDR